jgi:excisionase family DNA binding protein
MHTNTIYAQKATGAGHLVGGMSVEEAARFLGIGRSLVFEEIKARRLIARKAGRRTIIAYDDALDYLRSLPVIGAAV